MDNPILALSLAGGVASMIWWFVSMSGLNSYTASLGLDPRSVPFGKIWKDTQIPAYPQLMGLIYSTMATVACIVFAPVTGHGSLPPPHHSSSR
jgi:hypothetical protein